MASVSHKPATASTSAVEKRKKPPACDYCKARRVICHSQPDGKPCPRCVEKDIICTTTPVVRRQPKRRAKAGDPAPCAAPATSNASLSRARHIEQTDDGTPATWGSAQPRLPTSDAILTWRDAHPVPATLVMELMKLFPSLPQSLMPIVPYRRIHDQLEACGWDPSQLQPHASVLAYSIMAVTARVSTHPLLIGADVTDTRLVQFLASGNVMITPGLDLREFGRRRDAFCRRLHDEARKLAHETGVTVVTSEETAATCYLLDFLEASTNPDEDSMTYTAAMIWHVRTLAESEDRSELFSDNYRRLQWPLQLMHCAALSLCSGRSIPFTEHDERLICGPPPEDIEAATITLASESVTGPAIITFIYSFASYVTHLARQSSEKLIGPYARRFPLDEAALISHIEAIEVLQKTCVFLHDCIDVELPKATRERIRPALAKGLFVTSLAAPCLLVPLYRELKRRMEQGSIGVLPEGADPGAGDGFGDAAARTRARIEFLYRRVRSMTIRATGEAQARGPQLPTLAYMTHFPSVRFATWTRLFVDECEAMDMTPLERHTVLEKIAALMKLDGFAWIDRLGSLSWIEEKMAHLQGQQQLVPHITHDNAWEDMLGSRGIHDVLPSSDLGLPHLERDNDHDYAGVAWGTELTQSCASITPDFPTLDANLPSALEDTDLPMHPFELPHNFVTI
ncbi:hypothetical protein HDZ31DRAFT_36108 [Schizophyllum fasciatum]